eukprot:scaffold164346_cov17-Tisochrysis_lutea.AAC.1
MCLSSSNFPWGAALLVMRVRANKEPHKPGIRAMHTHSNFCSESAMREVGKGCSWPTVQVAIRVDALLTPCSALMTLSRSLCTQGHC